MSLPSYVVRCERCDLRQRFDDFGCGDYALGQRVRWPIESERAWCSHCGLTHVELLPTLDELEERRATIAALPASRSNEVTGLEVRCAHRCARTRRGARLAFQSQAPPRCLQCGATDTAPCEGDLDDGTLIHRAAAAGFASEEWSMVLPGGSRFTREGAKIDQ